MKPTFFSLVFLLTLTTLATFAHASCCNSKNDCSGELQCVPDMNCDRQGFAGRCA